VFFFIFQFLVLILDALLSGFEDVLSDRVELPLLHPDQFVRLLYRLLIPPQRRQGVLVVLIHLEEAEAHLADDSLLRLVISLFQQGLSWENLGRIRTFFAALIPTELASHFPIARSLAGITIVVFLRNLWLQIWSAEFEHRIG